MQLSATLLFTAFASLVAAQNPFSFVTLPASIKTGEPFEITWSPSTGTVDTVTLILRQGDPDHLATVITIAGSFFHLLCLVPSVPALNKAKPEPKPVLN
jgi:hypothetical protein